MVFSSLVFLFIFLPVVLITYHLIPQGWRNLHLLLASLFFYAWGEGVYILIMLFSVTTSFFIGKSFAVTTGKTRQGLLALGVILCLFPLLFYKYSPFIYENIKFLLPAPANTNQWSLHLPLGVSFFTFQVVSYIIDVYRGDIPPQTSLLRLGLFITFFPQLIAGPIVRYKDIFTMLGPRKISIADFSYGVERFIIGLGKKVLLANPLSSMADTVFEGLQAQDLSCPAVWIGASCYMIQLYFDFSGYSDMAIGLGRMFGFTFLENFNYPYISKSITEFWRRWHISLSGWFRDYLFIPLGGSRKGPTRTVINLWIVFIVCGLWHGASWTYLIWGIFHGFFMTIERGRLGHLLNRLPSPLGIFYFTVVFLVSLTIFRSLSVPHAGQLLAIMFGFSHTASLHFKIFSQMTPHFYTIFICGMICSTPLFSFLFFPRHLGEETAVAVDRGLTGLAKYFLLIIILILSVCSLATGAYNPFIYFRF
jgi:alginate O-acetyltransferase complex protein AlgI